MRWMVFASLVTACDGAEVPEGPEEMPDGALTYWADARPVLDAHCVRCHNPAGSAPFDFTNPETATAFAETIAAATAAGRMPPPASDPTCRPYAGDEHLVLPADKQEILAAWAADGAWLGDEATYQPPTSDVRDALDEVDLQVMLPQPYTPSFADPSNPGNEYRCFYLDPGLETDVWVRGMHPIVDQPQLVHHVVLFTVPKSSLPAGYDPAVGENCIDGTMSNLDGMLAAWAPGMLPVEMPYDVGVKLTPNQLLVLQMHYYKPGPDVEGLADQSGYTFDLVDRPGSEAFMVPLGPQDFRIPPGDDDHTDVGTIEIPSWIWFDIDIFGTFPHMHGLGRSYRVWVERPDGSERCLARGDYDFETQMTYMFREPTSVTGGDRVHVECTWDNSAEGASEVRYGERTDEEMCYAFTYVSLAF